MFFPSQATKPLPSFRRLRTTEGDYLLDHHFKMLASLRQYKSKLYAEFIENNDNVMIKMKKIDILDSVIRLLAHFNETLPYSLNGKYALTEAQQNFLKRCYTKTSQVDTPLQTLFAEIENFDSLRQILENLHHVYLAEMSRNIEYFKFFKERQLAFLFTMNMMGLILLTSVIMQSALLNSLLGAGMILLPMLILCSAVLAPSVIEWTIRSKEKMIFTSAEEIAALENQISELNTMQCGASRNDNDNIGMEQITMIEQETPQNRL